MNLWIGPRFEDDIYRPEPWRHFVVTVPLSVLALFAMLLGSRYLKPSLPPPPEHNAIEARLVEVIPPLAPAGLQGGASPAVVAKPKAVEKPHPKKLAALHPRVVAPPIIAPSETSAVGAGPNVPTTSGTAGKEASVGIPGGAGIGSGVGIGNDASGARAIYETHFYARPRSSTIPVSIDYCPLYRAQQSSYQSLSFDRVNCAAEFGSRIPVVIEEAPRVQPTKCSEGNQQIGSLRDIAATTALLLPCLGGACFVLQITKRDRFVVTPGRTFNCLLIRREAFDKAGYFDESLVTAEDLDLSLRLAFHFQFLFHPEPVMVYNLSPHGLWLTHVATGQAISDHERFTWKALEMLPDSPRAREIREELPLRNAFHELFPLVIAGEFASARRKLTEVFRANPWSVRIPWVRSRAKWVTHQILLAAASPLSETREICSQILAAIPVGGFRDSHPVRLMLAEIWADIILSGVLRGRVGPPRALYAAARAIAYTPLNRGLMRRIWRVLINARGWRFMQYRP
jgi:hypothetical protein